MILAILHGIGIVLLWILLILLILLAYFLICPLWIRGEGGFEPESSQAYLKFRLLGFIHFWQIHYDKSDTEDGLKVYALWGRVLLYPRGRKNSDSRQSEKQNTEALEQQNTEEGEKKPGTEQEHVSDASTHQNEQPEVKASEAQSATAKTTRKKIHRKPVKSEGEKQAQKDKLKKIYQMVTDAQNKKAVSFILKQIGNLLRSMHFNLGGTDLTYALSEPDYTGYLTGVLAVLPFMYGEDIHISPDFESDEAYARGHVNIKAHLSPGMLVWILLRVIANGDCRRLLKQLKTMKNEHS